MLRSAVARKKLLTKEKVLGVINRWLVEHGKPPTVEELRRSVKVGSTRTVQRYLDWLEEEGDIERWHGARGIRPLKSSIKGLETRSIPLVGEVPAGHLMIADENFEGWVRLPKDFLQPQKGKFFLLRVQGDSMNKAKVQGELIDSRDLVLVRQQLNAASGDIVVALIDGEATIKRLIRGPRYCFLKPESTNLKHQPIVVNKDFRIQGVVTRVLKRGSEFLKFLEQ